MARDSASLVVCTLYMVLAPFLQRVQVPHVESAEDLGALREEEISQ